MNSLIRHIEYLMSRNDCVIIPGIGAVLAHYQSARIDCDTLTIIPPSRVFAFNPALKQSDGLLACSLAKAEGISYDAASAIVASSTEAMLRQLYSQGELPLGRLGTLSIASGALAPEFRAFVSPLSSASTCGLPLFDFSPAAPAARDQAPAAVASVRAYSPAGRFVRVAASVALLLGICMVASTPISVDNATLASLTPSVQKTPVEALMPADAPAVKQMPSILRITGSNSPIVEAEEAPQPKEQPKYLVIVGSFTSTDEARRFISLNDPSWQIIEAEGRIRVYSEGFANQSDAYMAVRHDREKYAGAWVYRVK